MWRPSAASLALVVFAPAVCAADPPPLDVVDPWAEPRVARFDVSDPWDELTVATLDIIDPWEPEDVEQPLPEPFVADPWAHDDVPTATFPLPSEVRARDAPKPPTASFPLTP